MWLSRWFQISETFKVTTSQTTDVILRNGDHDMLCNDTATPENNTEIASFTRLSTNRHQLE